MKAAYFPVLVGRYLLISKRTPMFELSQFDPELADPGF